MVAVGQRVDRDAEPFKHPEMLTHRAEPERTAARLRQFKIIKQMNQRADEHQDATRLRCRNLVDGVEINFLGGCMTTLVPRHVTLTPIERNTSMSRCTSSIFGT